MKRQARNIRRSRGHRAITRSVSSPIIAGRPSARSTRLISCSTAARTAVCRAQRSMLCCRQPSITIRAFLRSKSAHRGKSCGTRQPRSSSGALCSRTSHMRPLSRSTLPRATEMVPSRSGVPSSRWTPVGKRWRWRWVARSMQCASTSRFSTAASAARSFQIMSCRPSRRPRRSAVRSNSSARAQRQHDVFRPNAGARLRAVLDDAGYPLAVHARVAGQSLFGATRKSWLDRTPEGTWDESMVDGIYNQSYRVPNFLVETVDTPLPIPLYFMRSVGSTAAVFFWESFISELASQAGIDQYVYRRNLLAADPLAVRGVDAGAQARCWTTPAAPDLFRGIAYNCYIGRGSRFKTYVAEVAERARVDNKLRVKRVFCAVDPGLAVNPNTLAAQIEGGIGFAMTTALHSRITFSNGGADQSNFFDYPLLGIDEMPEVVPIVLPSDRPPQGFGEVVLAPLAPAIAQAVLQATGRRLDVMPFPDAAFRG